jgi:ADP-ribosyl-[dinitrogen reductase] hydrolase
MTLTTAQLDRACGVLLATAAGDALGAPYEFGPPRGPELQVAMVGGGSFGWEPGEWTDDTSMAIAIAEVAATGADLRQEQALDALAWRWHEWSHHAKDVGVFRLRLHTRVSQVRSGALHAMCPLAVRVCLDF